MQELGLDTDRAGQPPEPDRSYSAASAAVAAVAGAVDELLAVDLTVPGTGETLDLLKAVEVQIRRLQAVSLAVIGQIDQRGLAAPHGQTSTAGLIRQVITIGKHEAQQRVRVAAALTPGCGLTGAPIPPRYPQLADAITAGGLSPAQADVIASTITNFPADVPAEIRTSVEEFLIEQGRTLDPRTLGQVARQIALMADPDGTPDDRDAHEKMEFHLGRRQPNGLTRCWGQLDDLTAETLRVAFGALTAPHTDRHRNTDTAHQPNPADPTRTTDPTGTTGTDGAQLPTAETPTDDHPHQAAHRQPQPPDQPPSSSPPPPPADQPAPGEVWRPSRLPYDWAPLGTIPTDYPPPANQRCTAEPPGGPPPPGTPPPPATAPASSTGSPPATEPPPDRRSASTRRAHALALIATTFLDLGCAPHQAGERPHLLVTIDEQALRRRTHSGRLGYGDHLPIDTIRMLACDAKILPAVLAGPTEILDMGRATRTFNAACRRAIHTRDLGCVFPGCDIPGLWAEHHHIHHWADGGPSNYHNGVLLCRRHHTLVHHSDWQIQLAPHDGVAELIPPATHDPLQRPQRNTLHRPPTYPWPTPSIT